MAATGATGGPYKGTTRRYLATMENDSLYHTLAAYKTLLKGDLVGIPEVSYTFFRDRILPVVKKALVPDFGALVDTVYNACVKKKVIVNDRFAYFPVGPSQIKQISRTTDEKETEGTIFANMKLIWKKVTDECKKLLPKLNPTVTYNQVPHGNALMERPEGFKPDAISVLTKSKMPDSYANTLRYYLCNAAVLEEERINDTKTDREENLSKLLLGCNHVFVNDPLRRGVYGITVEDTNLRLYIFTRSGGIVSEPLNWVEAVKELIHIILAFTYATETALGFDETMHRYEIKDESEEFSLQYNIEIDRRHFRTVGRPLSDRRANFFASRGTRVFAAIEVEAQGKDVTLGEPDVAIKITWIRESKLGDGTTVGDQDRNEGTIIRDLKDRAAATGDEHYFPDILCDGYACVTVGENEFKRDATKEFIRGKPGDLAKETKGFYPGPTAINEPRPGTNPIIGSSRYESIGDIFNVPQKESVTGISNKRYTEPDVKKFLELRWVERVQYRIAYKGIGKTLAELPTMYDIVRGLLEGFRAIRVLHRLGYVHRDISIGNFLVFLSDSDPKWRLVLNDFEYIRKIAIFNNQEQVLTGTHQFMALEVLASQYQHYILGRRRWAQKNGQDPSEADTSDPNCDFHYNPLHDLEPFYWILLWFLLFRLPVQPSSPITREDVELQLNVANALFTETAPDGLGDPSYQRAGCLTGGAYMLNSVLKVIPKDFIDVGLNNCARRMVDHLTKCYETVEGNPKFKGANTPELLKMCPDWMYNDMELILEEYVNKLAETPIEVEMAERFPTDSEKAEQEEAEKAKAEKEREKKEKAEAAKAERQKAKAQDNKKSGQSKKKNNN